MDIIKLIEEKLEDPDVLKSLSGQIDHDKERVKKAAKLSVPTMLKALQRNANDTSGAISLEKALEDHKTDNIADVKSYIQNINKAEGDKVLSHMFGQKRSRVETNISREAGLDQNQTSNIMKRLAPLLLGFLGQKKSNESIGSNGISNLISNVLGGRSGMMDKVTDLLDKDGDGNITDDVGDMVKGLFNK